MQLPLASLDEGLCAALTILGSRNEDGSPLAPFPPGTPLCRQPRACGFCGEVFLPRISQEARRRFCGRSCSAKWRMTVPEIKAKCHTPEARAKRSASHKAWYQSGSESAVRNVERIRALNPTQDPEVRAKISRRLKAMNHAPSERGGNGSGLTVPQRSLLAVLGPTWETEFAVSLGRRTPGYPTCYKLDLAWPERLLGIEVDGNTHRSRRDQDVKKDAALGSRGWTVLRFWNQDVLNWISGGMQTGDSISMTLAAHGIPHSA